MRQLALQQKIASIFLKVVVIVSAIVGTALCLYAGRNSFMGGRNVFLYFTIQSNLALALISLIGLIWMLRGKDFRDFWYTIQFVGAISITLTGMVFCFVLAPTIKANAWSPQNVLTHVVVPVASVIDFFVTGVHGNIKKWKSVLVIVPPLFYVIFAAIGYVNHLEFAPGIYYPYFFLNWGSEAGVFGFTKGEPFMGCGWWIVILCSLLILFGFVYLLILDGLKKLLQRRKS